MLTMDQSEDQNNASHFWRESSRDFDNTGSFDDLDDSSLETSPFRGFEKEPKVVIERLNVQHFLNKPSLKPKKFNAKNNVLPQLVSTCFVKLVKEDLNELKKAFQENCRLNKIKHNGTNGIFVMHNKICEKIHDREKKFQNHLENKHMLIYKAGLTPKPQKRVSFSDHVIVHELQEYHRCRKCTKIFDQYKSLKTHMKQEHRKRKCYICHYCSNNFVDRTFFKLHIKLHCDVCGLLLENKRRYSIHRRGRCRVRKKYNCKTCQNLFFSYMDLKDHSYDHLEDLFICDICKEQHSNKCAVSHHISFLHSKKRPKELYSNRNLGNERLYHCNFCDMSTTDKDLMDKHVSILPDLNNRKRTGYKDYYFCGQCLRKFETETDMLQHKWGHFLNNSNHLQVKSHKELRSNSIPMKPQNEIQTIFQLSEKVPNIMQPRIVLERVDYMKPTKKINNVDSDSSDIDLKHNTKEQTKKISVKEMINSVIDVIGLDVGRIIDSAPGDEVDTTVTQGIVEKPHKEYTCTATKAVVDPKSKKTLLSRFQCKKCNKYYSSNYCLNRHIMSVHENRSKLRCDVCEESFVWPKLLETHRCIRRNIPEMPFDDARPEIKFDNYHDFGRSGIDELMNISESGNYMHSVDFELPAPIVQLTEYDNCVFTQSGGGLNSNFEYATPVCNSYKIIYQEVPIEF